MPFSTLGLGPNILKAVQEAGYKEPTPIQEKSIPLILAGHDLIGIAQTGTGKTAAFVLPILAKLAAITGGGNKPGTRALVLAPTRELVVQIEENVRIYASHLKLRMATVFGGVGERPQITALRAGVELVIATPGRLLDLMKRGCGDFSGLRHLVLDEADRMLDMGFLPDIRRIVRALPVKRQTLLFSATLSREIETLTQEFLQAPKTVEIGRRSNPAETVTQFIHEVPRHLKSALLLHLLSNPALETVLIFSRTKHGADRIARNLGHAGIKTAALHSNRSQNQRIRALNAFKSGEIRALVATDIAARGIDVDGISHVINFDFPMHPEDYVHRIGRTGRANQAGVATSFVTDEDRAALKALERFIHRPIERTRSKDFDYGTPIAAQSAGETGRGQGQNRPPRSHQPSRHGQSPRRKQEPRQEKAAHKAQPLNAGGKGGVNAGRNTQPQANESSPRQEKPRGKGFSHGRPSKRKQAPNMRGEAAWKPKRR